MNDPTLKATRRLCPLRVKKERCAARNGMSALAPIATRESEFPQGVKSALSPIADMYGARLAYLSNTKLLSPRYSDGTHVCPARARSGHLQNGRPLDTHTKRRIRLRVSTYQDRFDGCRCCIRMA